MVTTPTESVDVRFQNRRLARTFSSDRQLRRRYGDRLADAIEHRLVVLRNAETLSDVPITKPDRRHQLKGDRYGQYAVDLVHPKRLIFKPDHDPLPRKPDGGIDTGKVSAVMLVEVVDYHG